MEFFLSPDELRDVPTETLLEVFYARDARRVFTSCGGSLRRLLLREPHTRYGAQQRTLRAAQELVRRALMEELAERPVLDAPIRVRTFLTTHFAGFQEERFVALWVDAQHCLIEAEELFRGTVDQTAVYPRQVVRAALAHNAAGVIFAHNHPSMKAEPSPADVRLTTALKSALELVDVRVLDHFIVTDVNILSFAERGML